jgi:hypothetical protein
VSAPLLIKQLVSLIRFCQKAKKSGFRFRYSVKLVLFLKFLVANGQIYCFTVSADGFFSIYTKPLNYLNKAFKKFKKTTQVTKFFKKNIFLFSGGLFCFSTNLGLLDSQGLLVKKLGGVLLYQA